MQPVDVCGDGTAKPQRMILQDLKRLLKYCTTVSTTYSDAVTVSLVY